MAEAPKLVSLAYRIPLTTEELEWVGAFTVIWGQIDYFLGMCISGFLKLDPASAETLMVNMTTGPRLNLFDRLAKAKLTDDAMKKIAKDFSKELSPLIESRNHLMHGAWGYQTAAPPDQPKPAVYFPKTPDRPLPVEQLPVLIERAARTSHQIVTIAQHLYGFEWTHDPENPPTFFFGREPPPGWPKESS